MKSKLLFGLSYILNFSLSLAFVISAVYFTARERSISGNSEVLFLFSFSFLIIVMPFNWFCYLLHKAYKSNQQLSKKAKVTGLIFFILFFLLSILQILGSYDIISNVITDKSIMDNRLFVFTPLFLSMTATSIYLCFAYWVIRRQTKKQFVDIISQLGDEIIS